MLKKKLSVIVPVYNEEKTIIATLKRLEETKDTRVEYEVIVINDGSTDNTLKMLRSNVSLYQHLIDGKQNLGKGYAVKRGLEFSTGDYIIFQDGDLEYDPADFSKFIDIIQKFEADLIIGSRFNYNKYTRSFNILNKLGNYVLTFFLIFYIILPLRIYIVVICVLRNIY